MNIILIGMMGAGKTAVAKILGDMLGYRVYDTDFLIETKQACSISQIFVEQGENFFRQLETAAIKELSKEKNIVLSTGGGILINQENFYILKALGKLVYLRAQVATLATRLQAEIQYRPLLSVNDNNQPVNAKLDQLLLKRQSSYEKSDFVLDTDRLSARAVALKIKQQFNL